MRLYTEEFLLIFPFYITNRSVRISPNNNNDHKSRQRLIRKPLICWSNGLMLVCSRKLNYWNESFLYHIDDWVNMKHMAFCNTMTQSRWEFLIYKSSDLLVGSKISRNLLQIGFPSHNPAACRILWWWWLGTWQSTFWRHKIGHTGK